MLILVRHGRTPANARGLLLGRSDPALDAVGEAQARALAGIVGPVDRVITSPLTRARQTAAALGATVEVDDRWIELDYGEWDGRHIADVSGELWARWRGDLDFAPPGGEPLRALGDRVRRACEELADEAAERDVAVVTHVSPLKAAVAWTLGVGDEVSWRCHVATASVTRIRTGPGGPSLYGFNEVARTGGD